MTAPTHPLSHSAAQDREFRIAALLMVGTGLLFTIMVSFVKVARHDMQPLTIMLWRSAIALPVAWVWGKGKLPSVDRQVRPWLIGRCVLGFGAMFGFYFASAGVGVGELGFLSKLQPILLALFAPLLLGRGERVTARVWGVILVSFVGVCVLLSPNMQGIASLSALWSSSFAPYAGMALVASACSAIAHLCVRRLGASLSPHAIVLYFQLFVGALALGILLVRGDLIVPQVSAIPILLGVGLSSTVGQMFLTMAYAKAKAAKIATVSYISPIWGVLIDAVYFHQPPTAAVWVGGALILLAGLSLVRAPTRRG